MQVATFTYDETYRFLDNYGNALNQFTITLHQYWPWNGYIIGYLLQAV